MIPSSTLKALLFIALTPISQAEIPESFKSHDPFDPAVSIKAGPLKGKTPDTRTKRKIYIISDSYAYEALNVSPREYSIIANFSHSSLKRPTLDAADLEASTEHYLAAIPKGELEGLRFEKTMFFTKDESAAKNAQIYDDELLAHVQFQFEFKQDKPIRLLVAQSKVAKLSGIAESFENLSDEDWERIAGVQEKNELTLQKLIVSLEATFIREEKLNFFSGGYAVRDAFLAMLRITSDGLRTAEVYLQHGGNINKGKVVRELQLPPLNYNLSQGQFFASLLNGFLNESHGRDLNDTYYSLFTWSCHTLPFQVIDSVLTTLDPGLVPSPQEQIDFYYQNDGEKIRKLKDSLKSYLDSAQTKGLSEKIATELSRKFERSITAKDLTTALSNLDASFQKPLVPGSYLDKIVTSPLVEALPSFLEENLQLRGLLEAAPK